MDARGLPFRTFTILVIGLLVVYVVATSTSHASLILFNVAVIGLAILLSSIVLIPAVRQAVKARLDTPAGRIISASATVMFLLAVATYAMLWWWWEYFPGGAPLHHPVLTRNWMLLFEGTRLMLLLTAPIAWRWLATRMMSRPPSSLAFFRTRPGPMLLLIVLCIIFVLLAPQLREAMQPWADIPWLRWLPIALIIVSCALWSVLILATLSGVAQLLLRCFGRRDNLPAVH
ncbi:hypothetical protein ATCM_10505 [Stenotrophomonas sp. ATCM1_4]|uniref:hypothetical protein n=1 Tax=Stenotrophomonas sp. ATCM1_4 TaxID=2259330 RepID=UPI001045CB0E|nr:hypothetical protein [Stenotrophomonas sp. ATCM1_4]TDB28055.1 hypothetical protein ATCM_10505 [Stenotrophomonas sp. ATCM1_4]